MVLKSPVPNAKLREAFPYIPCVQISTLQSLRPIQHLAPSVSKFGYIKASSSLDLAKLPCRLVPKVPNGNPARIAAIAVLDKIVATVPLVVHALIAGIALPVQWEIAHRVPWATVHHARWGTAPQWVATVHHVQWEIVRRDRWETAPQWVATVHRDQWEIAHHAQQLAQ